MMVLFIALFGCKKSSTFETTFQPPFKSDIVYNLEDNCSVDFIQGCEQINSIKAAQKALAELHSTQMKEMVPLILKFNRLLNQKDKPPMLNLTYEQPDFSRWTTIGMEEQITVETRMECDRSSIEIL